jgi:hypothetical protein
VITTPIQFKKLNQGWNAEPNAPDPKVTAGGGQVQVRFYLNHQRFDTFAEDQIGVLTFENCTRWRLGSTNDEGWYMGQCRYSKVAPGWGEFYEVSGQDDLLDLPQDWHFLDTPHNQSAPRHFLFYFRDNTFECLADSSSFKPDPAPAEG